MKHSMEIEKQHVESLSTTEYQMCVKNFIWCNEEWPEINFNTFTDTDDIPLISLNGNRVMKQSNEFDKICQEMVMACRTWGFFKLVDHGVNSETIDYAVVQVNKFFNLPMEQKLRGGRSESLPLGYSSTNPDYVKNLPWAEILQLLQSPQQVAEFARRVFGDPNHPLSDALTKYMDALDKLGMTILEMLAHGLGLPRDFFLKNFQKKEETMIRINSYPLCPLPEKCLGLGSHSDPHCLTILLQDDVGGLQVMKNDNKWVGVRPIPNSFVINIGDTLEAWTNGKLKSVVHRAVVNKEKKRLSIAYFLSPTDTTIIDSPFQLLDHQDRSPRKYVPFTWEEFKRELLIQKRVVGKTALNRYRTSRRLK